MDDGLVKSIGISNFSCKKIDTLLAYARIKPAAVQVEVHPYFRNQKLVDHCKAKVWLFTVHGFGFIGTIKGTGCDNNTALQHVQHAATCLRTGYGSLHPPG